MSLGVWVDSSVLYYAVAACQQVAKYQGGHVAALDLDSVDDCRTVFADCFEEASERLQDLPLDQWDSQPYSLFTDRGAQSLVRVTPRWSRRSRPTTGFLLAPYDPDRQYPEPANLIAGFHFACGGFNLDLVRKTKVPDVVLLWQQPLKRQPRKTDLPGTPVIDSRVTPFFRVRNLVFQEDNLPTREEVYRLPSQTAPNPVDVARCWIDGIETFLLQTRDSVERALKAELDGLHYVAGYPQVIRSWIVTSREVIANLPEDESYATSSSRPVWELPQSVETVARRWGEIL